jgi:hypothetical protein
MKKHDKMIERLYAEVDEGRLLASMMAVFEMRRKRSGLSSEFRLGGDPLEILDEFLRSSSIEQLKMLRQIAESLIVERVEPEEVEACEGLDVVDEIVQPPTQH